MPFDSFLRSFIIVVYSNLASLHLAPFYPYLALMCLIKTTVKMAFYYIFFFCSDRVLPSGWSRFIKHFCCKIWSAPHSLAKSLLISASKRLAVHTWEDFKEHNISKQTNSVREKLVGECFNCKIYFCLWIELKYLIRIILYIFN